MRDSRFKVFVCMAKMNDGIWYPMPHWAAHNNKKYAAQALRKYLNANSLWIRPSGKFTKKIRFDEYFPKKS